MDLVLPPEGEDLADVVADLDDDAWAAVSAPPMFRVDRPLLFAVTDTQTGTALFLGAVADPTA